ncbi:uncharacterized protein [Physeter macrocephalus]|uniref:Uncharacterized protein n=1 Tax=Physeter macrocephalus TaxID=9755 RepID=A0A455AVX2_PHYMC|nr:uncharacterized protein LOC114484369 [Physeter catodon]|eukprot:XP_028336006.1 uncharacterized protein LOC114484369 [Physeter catodon]
MEHCAPGQGPLARSLPSGTCWEPGQPQLLQHLPEHTRPASPDTALNHGTCTRPGHGARPTENREQAHVFSRNLDNKAKSSSRRKAAQWGGLRQRKRGGSGETLDGEAQALQRQPAPRATRRRRQASFRQGRTRFCPTSSLPWHSPRAQPRACSPTATSALPSLANHPPTHTYRQMVGARPRHSQPRETHTQHPPPGAPGGDRSSQQLTPQGRSSGPRRQGLWAWAGRGTGPA